MGGLGQMGKNRVDVKFELELFVKVSDRSGQKILYSLRLLVAG